MAMLACARIGAIHSVVFGGFAANELATRIDDAQPKVILTASCGIEPGRVVAYKPLLDEAIELARHTPDASVILQRPQLSADMRAQRPRLGRARRIGIARRLRPGVGHRPALHPVHVRNDRPAQGCGARQRRSCRGAGLEHAEHLRRRAGRGVLGGVRRRVGRRALLHRVRAVAVGLHHRALRGEAGRNPRPRSVLAGHLPARRLRALHRPDRLPGDQT